MKHRISIAIARLQLLLLLVVTFPRELVHELHGCVDTNDCAIACSWSDVTISEKHHHCDLLQLDAPVLYTLTQSFDLHCPEFIVATESDQDIATVDCSLIDAASRAPPLEHC